MKIVVNRDFVLVTKITMIFATIILSGANTLYRLRREEHVAKKFTELAGATSQWE